MTQWEKALEKAREALRCGARTRQGSSCQAPAMKNKRCRMHGGKSPGAPLGKAHGRYTHGLYTKEAKQERCYVRELIRQCRQLF